MVQIKATPKQNGGFGLLDVLRIIGGLLIFNAFFSWWFTSTSTWGYRGRWIDSRYLRHRIRSSYVNLTLPELSLYNGTDASLPIYIAINGLVYDVSNSRSIYGPTGAYCKLAGKDAARVYVTGCFDIPEQYTYDLRDLDPAEATSDILQWQNFFANHRKYWYVGTVQKDEITGPAPAPCSHRKHPRYYVS